MGDNSVISSGSLFEAYHKAQYETECLSDKNSTLLLTFLFQVGGATSYELESDFENNPKLLEDILKRLRELRLIYSYSLNGTGVRFVVGPKGLKVIESLGINTSASWSVLERGANLVGFSAGNFSRQELLIEALVNNYVQQNKNIGSY